MYKSNGDSVLNTLAIALCLMQYGGLRPITVFQHNICVSVQFSLTFSQCSVLFNDDCLLSLSKLYLMCNLVPI